MMSSGSESEEFFDAEEAISGNDSRTLSRRRSRNLQRANSEPNVIIFALPSSKSSPKGGRRKFKELRERLHVDDDEGSAGNVTPSGSQPASVDGDFASSSQRVPSHPFRIIEQDTVSLQSINSIGRITRGLGAGTDNVHGSTNKLYSSSSLESCSTPSLKGNTNAFISSLFANAQKQDVDNAKCRAFQEPDVIASTKNASNKSSQLINPVAPPRKKKRLRTIDNAASKKTIDIRTSLLHENDKPLNRDSKISVDNVLIADSSSSKSGVSLRSGFSLDINQAIRGQFVVKPQDTESIRGCKAISAKSIENVIEIGQDNPPSTDDSKQTANGSTRGSVGHYSLGPHRGTNQQSSNERTSKERRRKSAGDENLFKDLLSLKVRTHTDSGKQLSDLEILQQVTVLNLDTGEQVPLSVAEDKIPQCINPLSLHIMRLTSEYVSSNSTMDAKDIKSSQHNSILGEKEDIHGSSDGRNRGSGSLGKNSSIGTDGENDDEDKAQEIEDGNKIKEKAGAMFKRIVNTAVKKTVDKAKSIAQARHKENLIDIADLVNGTDQIKLRASHTHKGPYEFEKMEHTQELLGEHEGPIWCMKFSWCGRLLATAGEDRVLRIWVVRDAFSYFRDMRKKYNVEKASPTPSQESIGHISMGRSMPCQPVDILNGSNENLGKMVFMPKPFCMYFGHTSDLLDVSWSKNYFILSSSMDKTVRLWHISRKECLCCFQHIDFVTAIVFHPRDDRYFLSGSLDGKLRLWNIPDKKVALWNEVEGVSKLITAANFYQNGTFVVIGTYDGRCIFYHTDQLKYHTQIHVRSTRGRNATGRKITGIEPLLEEGKVLVTSNDSRIRLYDLRDLNVSCKYKGCVNVSSQIKASFSHDGKFIVSGSENRDIYIWKTSHDYAKFTSVRRDRNDFWEAIKAHNAMVTCAIFAPNPENIIRMVEEQSRRLQDDAHVDHQKGGVSDPLVEQHTKGCAGYVLISADFSGCIKVFINKVKPKHSSLPASALA